MSDPDIVVVGAGPNGLTAAAFLARAGLSVRVVEAALEAGGGAATRELTLPGFRHDVCSAVHPFAWLSPAFASLGLERHGLKWLYPAVSVAHPLDDREAILLHQDLARTASQLGRDAGAYVDLLEPFLRGRSREFVASLLSPLAAPPQPLRMARFGLHGLRSAESLARRFKEEPARALLAGCAAHSILPFSELLTGAMGLTFLLAGHVRPWPVAAGGSGSVAQALVSVCRKAGVEFVFGEKVDSLRQLAPSRAVVFDLVPAQVAQIAADALPSRYRKALSRYVMGPGCFKLDFALDGPIPWRDPEVEQASTVHVGGSFEEIARGEATVWKGEAVEKPFVLVCQQAAVDPSRAPEGKQTGYAYAHVPAGSTEDISDRIEAQIERYAPGFRDRILARHVLAPGDFERMNPSHIGGAITGGAANWRQLFTRPVPSMCPWATPNPKLFLCSQSTPPGGGIHGMCGLHAARAVLERRFGLSLPVP